MSQPNTKLVEDSPFIRSMSELCLKILFEFTSIPERFEWMRVCKLWNTTLHQPYLWLNVSWRELHPDSPSITSPPMWLRPLLSGLTIVTTAPQRDLLTLFQPWTHLSHLSLSWPHYQGYSYPITKEESTTCLQEWMTILTSLRLVSFEATDVSNSIQAAVFSCDPPSPFQQPAIIRWSKTLKEFRLDLLRPPAHWPFSALVLVESWPVLESFNFRGASHDLTNNETHDLIDFFSGQRLPALRILTLNYEHEFYHKPGVNNTEVCPALYDALSHLHGLEEINVNLRSSERGPVSISQPFTALRTHLGINYVATLQRLSFDHRLTPPELEFIPKCAQLQELRFDSHIILRLPNVEFFEMIGAHHLPHLHTLAFGVSLDPGTHVSPLADSIRIKEIIRGMKSLEKLELWSREEDEDEESDLIGSWLESIHLFPALTQFSLEFETDEHPLLSAFLLSLANAPYLRVLELTHLNISQLSELARFWHERHQRVEESHATQTTPGLTVLDPSSLSVGESKTPVLRSRPEDNGDTSTSISKNVENTTSISNNHSGLVNSTMNSDSSIRLSVLPIQIHSLAIKYLSIHPVPFNQTDYAHPMVEIMQHLAVSLLDLISLNFRLYMIQTPRDITAGSIRSMTSQARARLAPEALKNVGAHWKEIIRFKHLRTLVLDEEYSITSAVLKTWSQKGQHLQQLERLEFGSDTLIGCKPTDLIAHLLRLPRLKYFSPWACFGNFNPSTAIEAASKAGRHVSLLNGPKANQSTIHQLSFITK